MLLKKNNADVIVLEKKNMPEECWTEMEAAIRKIAERYLGIQYRRPHSKEATIRHLKEIARGGR